MKTKKWLGISVALVLAAACFMNWVSIDSKQLVLTGMNTSGTAFGKPGYFHLVLVFVFLIFSVTPRIWAKRMNLLVTAVNLAWALRNFMILAGCSGGECPVRKAGIWLVLLASVGMLISSFFPDMKIKEEKKPESPNDSK